MSIPPNPVWRLSLVVMPLALLVSLVALADDAVAPGTEKTAETSAGEAPSQVTLSHAQCQELLRKDMATSSSGAAYVPGRDARGNRVVSAEGDGAPPPSLLAETVTVELGVDLAQRYGWQGGLSGRVALPSLTIEDGHPYWNDRLLDSADRETVLRHCRRAVSQDPGKSP